MEDNATEVCCIDGQDLLSHVSVSRRDAIEQSRNLAKLQTTQRYVPDSSCLAPPLDAVDRSSYVCR